MKTNWKKGQRTTQKKEQSTKRKKNRTNIFPTSSVVVCVCGLLKLGKRIRKPLSLIHPFGHVVVVVRFQQNRLDKTTT
jgi:hypothetical protein